MKLHLYEMTVAFVKKHLWINSVWIFRFLFNYKGIFFFFRNRETPGLDSSYNTICQLTDVGFLTWLLYSWKTGHFVRKVQWYNKCETMLHLPYRGHSIFVSSFLSTLIRATSIDCRFTLVKRGVLVFLCSVWTPPLSWARFEKQTFFEADQDAACNRRAFSQK